MAAAVTGLTRDGNEGTFTRAPLELRPDLTLTDTYWVETTDGVNDRADIVMLAGGLPRMGDHHPRIPQLVVVSIVPHEVAGRRDRWRVEITYQPEFHELPDLWIGYDMHRVPVEGGTLLNGSQNQPAGGAGINGGGLVNGVLQWGTPVLNSAGEAFVPPPEGERAGLVVKLSRNEQIFDLDGFCKFNDSLNQNVFLGKQPRQWWLAREGRPIPNSLGRWWRMEYVMKFKKETWDIQKLDQGRYYRETPGVPPAGALIPFKNNEGDNILGNLDGKGGALAAGQAPFWIRWCDKEVLDWSELELEQSIADFYSTRQLIEQANLDPGALDGILRGIGFGA